MKITLQEALDLSSLDSWEGFCDLKGYSYFVVNEGGGDIEVEITIDELKELSGIDLLMMT